MRDFLHHLFLPRESNNHRAKILHNKSIFFIIFFLFIGQFLVFSMKTNFPYVLGVTTNISSEDLLLLTNQKRQENGLSPLVLNNQLSKAALFKAKDMFEKNYWAHNSPEGITPWVFIKNVGYDYVYAGENLARGFTTSESVVGAWMASSSHKENILSKDYKEIGFAVLKGKLLGEETTLIVEMFGSGVSLRAIANAEKEIASNASPAHISNIAGSKFQAYPASFALRQNGISEAGWANIAVDIQPLIDSNGFSLSISIILLSIFIFIFILDMIIVERKKISRFVGHNIDHIFFLTGILIFLVIFTRGIVL